MGQSSVEFSVSQRRQALTVQSYRGDGGQALLGATAMFLLVQPDHCLDDTALIGVQVAAVDQVFRDLPTLVATPNTECGHELVLIDQPVL